MRCALKWEGFWLPEDEVETVCLETSLEFAGAVLAAEDSSRAHGQG